ncbi:hypothetical protein [Paludisphaera mucosa]|uniref:LysM domain-containing protein n=1 Tax=Paludisphaera mucosa TaxID=3030827 RepID=A0ABT6F504_9BACT|nr:hypothetical protein [Paludisphaera mucosa]MDG3002667.1 hypothetical protein [Paludisphaera mucosa]
MPAPRRTPPAVAPPTAPAEAPRADAGKAQGSIAIPRGEPESTLVDEGETLEDVALRVYGSREAVETLRQANRAFAARRGPIRSGSMLWTPAR